MECYTSHSGDLEMFIDPVGVHFKSDYVSRCQECEIHFIVICLGLK